MRGSAAFRAAVAPGGVLAGPWVKNGLWRRARAVPSLDLRFAENKSLVDATTGANLVTFTRAGSGTYVDSQGVIRSAVTNLLLQSEDFSTTWATTDLTVSTNTTTAPTGTATADTLTISGAAGAIFPTQNITITESVVYTISIFINTTQSCNFVRFRAGTAGGSLSAWFTVSTRTWSNLGSGFSGGTFANYGNNWVRASIQYTPAVGDGGSRSFGFGGTTAAGSTTADTGNTLIYWGAQLEQSSTVGEYIPTTSVINSAPRFDHDPTTGESLGLLVEEARTNGIRNNTMVGASAPSTIPTNWSALSSAAGISFEVVGVGTESGISYIDIRAYGTPAANGSTQISLEQNATNAAASGETWTISSYCRLMAGTLPGFTTLLARIGGSGGSFLTSSQTTIAPTGSSLISQRFTHVAALSNASTEFITARIDTAVFSGVPVDFTLRIGMPQLEKGAFATSVIPTTTATVTRAADVASISGSNFNTSQFARATTATFYNSSGIITTANVDIPRNNYNPTTLVAEGLLLEPQRSNIVLQSNGFDTTWSNTNSTETASAGTSPDGTNNAWELKDTLDGSAVQHQLVQSGINYTAGKLYTASLHVKAGTLPRVAVVIGGPAMTAGNRSFVFDMTTETFVASGNAISGPSFTKLPNGWYRINMTYTADATDVAGIVIRLVTAANVTGSYQGDGTGTILIYGAQIEEGPDMTSYIPTTTTEVTRSADVPAVSPWYRQDEGTVFAQHNSATWNADPNFPKSFAIGTDDNNGFWVGSDPVGNVYRYRVRNGGSNQFGAANITRTPIVNNKTAIGVKSADFAVAADGGNLATGSSGTMPTADQLLIGRDFSSVNWLNQPIRRLTYWPARLPNSTLQTITQ